MSYKKYKEKYKAYSKAYYREHKDEILERHRKWRETHREEHRRLSRNWNKRHPDRWRLHNGNSKRTPEERRAHGYIYRHPELVRTDCEFCSSAESLCGHHLDYSFPYIIVTVCRTCHKWLHGDLIVC